MRKRKKIPAIHHITIRNILQGQKGICILKYNSVTVEIKRYPSLVFILYVFHFIENRFFPHIIYPG